MNPPPFDLSRLPMQLNSTRLLSSPFCSPSMMHTYNPTPPGPPAEAAAEDARHLESDKRETLKSHVLLEARRARLTAELQVG